MRIKDKIDCTTALPVENATKVQILIVRMFKCQIQISVQMSMIFDMAEFHQALLGFFLN